MMFKLFALVSTYIIFFVTQPLLASTQHVVCTPYPPTLTAEPNWTHPDNPSGGINIGGPSPFSNDQYNIDLFKGAQLWWQDDGKGFYSFQNNQRLELDQYGWLKSLPKDKNGAEQSVVAPFSDVTNTRPGRYVLIWQGEGTVDYDGTVCDRKDHRWILDITESAFHIIKIVKTDPNKNGNYIRNISIFKLEDEPLIQGGELFQPDYIDKISRFRVLRVMSALNINSSTVTDWIAARESVQSATWINSVPMEAIVRLSNTGKTDLWLNVPHMATDDYVRKLAAYVRANLDPNLRVYLEYSNEFFTNSLDFSQYQYFVDKGIALFGANAPNSNAQYYAYRASQVFDVFNSTFGATTPNRLFPVLTVRHADDPKVFTDMLTGPDIVRIGGKRPIDGLVKILATDTYLGFELGGLQDTNQTLYSWINDPTGTKKLINALRTGNGLEYRIGLPFFKSGIDAVKSVADQFGLQLYAYEGGSALVTVTQKQDPAFPNDPTKTVPVDPAVVKAFVTFFGKANRDPAMKALYSDMYAYWRLKSGGINAHFATFSFDNIYGNFSTWDSVWAKRPIARGAIPVSDNDISFNDTRDQRLGSVFINGRLMLGAINNDSLKGTPQADRIYGGNGNDVLNGNGGADYLSGGTGGDTYIVTLGTSNGTIIDDNGLPNDPQDVIKLTDISNISQLNITRSGKDLLIKAGSNQLRLKNQFAIPKNNFIEQLMLSDGSVVELSKFGK